MASRERAIVNNLNERARFYGQVDMLTVEKVRAVLHFYDYSSCKSGTKPATSIDHVIALAHGGTNTVDNLQLLTIQENKQKGDEDVDYRAGKVCTEEYVTEHIQEIEQKQTKVVYRHHDWDAYELEYVTDPLMTLDKVADTHNCVRALVYKQSVKHGWFQKKLALHGVVDDEARERAKKAMVDGELSSRMVLHDVIEVATQAFLDKPKASASDLAALLKLGLATQDEPTENIRYVELVEDDDVIEAAERIARRHDRQAEAGYIARSPTDEDGQGAGWTD